MKGKVVFSVLSLIVSLAVVGMTLGQFRRGRYRDDPRMDDRAGVPEWETDQDFKKDVFTFVRVRYSSYGRRGWRGGWQTDYPDSDLNFSYRLQELTSLEVDPDGEILKLTDEELFD